MRLAFLASHGGSGMRAVLGAISAGELDAEGVLCISNNSGSPALAHARGAGLDTLHLSAKGFPDPGDLDAAMLSALQEAGADTVVLSGYMKALGPAVLAVFAGRLLNVHPSLLPNHGGRGMYGDRVHGAVLAAGERESGATVHLVEEGIDEGPVLAQARVPVLPGDTLDTLRARVMAVEGPLLVGVLRDLGGAAVKRKVFDLRNWARVARHEQAVSRLPGYVVVEFRALEVARPLDLPSVGRTLRLLDNGYRWLRIHPHGAGEGVMGHALTVQLDADGVPVQLYVDIHGGEGLTGDGYPWHDDLYLDVLGHLDPVSWRVTGVEFIDQDELQEAQAAGRVSGEQVRETYAEAEWVRASLLAGTFPPLLAARRYLGLSQS